jgi:hypothetical protein
MLPEGVLIDPADAPLVQGYRWVITTSLTGQRQHRYVKARNGAHVIALHRLIAGAAPGQFVDHINGDGLDNRRTNLRLCTPAENARNARRRAGTQSGLKGVRRNGDRWWASIDADGRRYGLGNYATAQEAHAAYSLAAQLLHGDFHNLG